MRLYTQDTRHSARGSFDSMENTPPRPGNRGQLDDTDQRILHALQKNARLTYAELGRQVNLSAPAVAERVKKLEERHIIAGYHAHLNRAALGLSVVAFIRLDTPARLYPQVISYAKSADEIVECHHISGEGAFLCKTVVRSLPDLERVIAQLAHSARPARPSCSRRPSKR